MNGQIQYGASHEVTSATTGDDDADAEPAPHADLRRRLMRFRHELRLSGSHPSRAGIDRLLALARELALDDQDIREELNEIAAAREGVEMAEAIARHGLPVATPLAPLPADEQCHFVAPVRFGRRRSDQIGHLELTTARVKFTGTRDITVSWPEVDRIDRAGREIVISLANSRRVLRFACSTAREAARGAIIGRHLAEAVAT